MFANLIFLALRPVIEIAFELLYVSVKRSIKNRAYQYHSNNSNDCLKYEEIFGAPEYLFHKKLASLNAAVFITIVFGLAFPLFYIVCILAFVIKYVVERYTLARFYKLPKKHSQLLTDQNYRVQAGMPLFGFLIAFWMFGNKQMYDTKVHEIDTEYQLLNSYHTIGKTAKNLFTEYFASISGLESICITSFVAISIFYSVAFVLYRQSKKL